MIVYILSLLPRRWLQESLFEQWKRSLPMDQQVSLDYWGIADPKHHEFQWADALETKEIN